MARLGHVIFTGKSGKKYTLDAYDIKSSWSEVAVVYIATRAEEKPDGGYTHHAIYIGQTDNLKERFKTHLRQGCFEKNKANRLCLLMEKDLKTRLSIESDLIGLWKPPCND